MKENFLGFIYGFRTGRSQHTALDAVYMAVSTHKVSRAINAIHEGVADCLFTDYAPATLIMAVMSIPGLTDLDLPSTVRLVTANPAKAAKLDDRGSIEVGKLAYCARYDHG